MLQTLFLYFHTLKYLKWVQIRYQMWYRVRSKFRKITGFKYAYNVKVPQFQQINFVHGVKNDTSFCGNQSFSFLNIPYKFDDEVNWDFDQYGKLWTYNLNYFEYLNQENSVQYETEFRVLMNDFICNLPNLKNANEPFPTSLRIINWVKYCCTKGVDIEELNASLYSQSYILADNIEYHLMGNHLLENGFALTTSGIYFQDIFLYDKGKKILETELEEQILHDGAHFELSPMYHSLMLYRLLDTINIINSNLEMVNQFATSQNIFLDFLMKKATLMVGWLKEMTFVDETLPHFNDSTDGIAPYPNQLMHYASKIGIPIENITLSKSGYKKIKNEHFDFIIKVGKIGPDYIPGHAHADSLSFVCHIKNLPFIVDTGISTYEKNAVRHQERSTKYHNTITVDDANSSEVWGGFRVGNRAKSEVLSNDVNTVSAAHDGYGMKHYRTITLIHQELIIEDRIHSTDSMAHFHFAPNVTVENKDTHTIICDGISIHFTGAKSIQVESYNCSKGFNHVVPATKAIVSFEHKLTTQIRVS